ncbi:MAG: hypothetical protein R2844_23170 [Caldilineales bacterium]
MNPFARVLSQIPQASQELDLLPKIEQLANAADPASARQIVEDTPALLGELASSLLLELIEESRRQGSEAIAQTLEDTLSLLQTARSEGIEQAFIEASGAPDAGMTRFGDFADVPVELADQVQNALALQAIYGVARQPQDLNDAADRWRSIVADPAFAGAPVVFRLPGHQIRGADADPPLRTIRSTRLSGGGHRPMAQCGRAQWGRRG